MPLFEMQPYNATTQPSRHHIWHMGQNRLEFRLLLAAANRNGIANLKSFFGAMKHQQHNFSCLIYIRHAAPPYAACTIVSVSIYVGWIESSVLFFSIRGPRLMKSWDCVGTLSNAIPWVSISNFVG